MKRTRTPPPTGLHSQSVLSGAELRRRVAGNANGDQGERPFPEVGSEQWTASQPQVFQAVIADYIDRHLKDCHLPLAIARFLDTHWRKHLLLTYASEGEGSQRWRDAIETMDDLIWSVQRKEDAGHRRKLFEMLPGLYQRLHEELESLGLSTAAEDGFFATIAKLHQLALYQQPAEIDGSPQGTTQGPATGEVAEAGGRYPAGRLEEVASVGDPMDADYYFGSMSRRLTGAGAKASSQVDRSLVQLWSDPDQIWFG